MHGETDRLWRIEPGGRGFVVDVSVVVARGAKAAVRALDIDVLVLSRPRSVPKGGSAMVLAGRKRERHASGTQKPTGYETQL